MLLYHTHATESFVSSGSAFAAADLSETITQLGAELADLLQNEYQIPVYHDRTIHDCPAPVHMKGRCPGSPPC